MGGVDEEIHKDLLNLRLVHRDHGQVFRQFTDEHDVVFADLVPDQAQRVEDELVECVRLCRQSL